LLKIDDAMTQLNTKDSGSLSVQSFDRATGLSDRATVGSRRIRLQRTAESLPQIQQFPRKARFDEDDQTTGESATGAQLASRIEVENEPIRTPLDPSGEHPMTDASLNSEPLQLAQASTSVLSDLPARSVQSLGYVASDGGVSTGALVFAGAALVCLAASGGGGSSAPLDTVPPVAPTLAVVSGAAAGAVTVAGESGATVTVTFANAGGSSTITKKVIGSGTAQAVVITDADVASLGQGTINVSATQTDAAGNVQTVAAPRASFTLQSAVVQDGLVKEAIAFIDVNKNGVRDNGEPFAKTDAKGVFTIASNAPGPIVATGGINIDTGLANTITLKAQPGSTVVNPITTLVNALVVEQSLTLTEAETAVKSALGLDSKLNLGTYDPFAGSGEIQRK